MIAIAIANNPDVIIADEPTTALDVTIQAQILDVLAKAQKETGAAVVLITHDLGVVAGAADDILVMYAGRPVERASIDDVFQHPSMPYTMGLLGAVPKPHIAASQRLVPIPGNRRHWSTSRRDARSRHDARSPPRSARCLSRTWKSWTRTPVISPPAVDCRRSSTRT